MKGFIMANDTELAYVNNLSKAIRSCLSPEEKINKSPVLPIEIAVSTLSELIREGNVESAVVFLEQEHTCLGLLHHLGTSADFDNLLLTALPNVIAFLEHYRNSIETKPNPLKEELFRCVDLHIFLNSVALEKAIAKAPDQINANLRNEYDAYAEKKLVSTRTLQLGNTYYRLPEAEQCPVKRPNIIKSIRDQEPSFR